MRRRSFLALREEPGPDERGGMIRLFCIFERKREEFAREKGKKDEKRENKV